MAQNHRFYMWATVQFSFALSRVEVEEGNWTRLMRGKRDGIGLLASHIANCLRLTATLYLHNAHQCFSLLLLNWIQFKYVAAITTVPCLGLGYFWSIWLLYLWRHCHPMPGPRTKNLYSRVSQVSWTTRSYFCLKLKN